MESNSERYKNREHEYLARQVEAWHRRMMSRTIAGLVLVFAVLWYLTR